jgi:large subunit ribosomal protein L25
MTDVKKLSATARAKVGKGAARAERRHARVPGIIYGNNEAPMAISVDSKELTMAIHAGRFLTTLFDVDLDGKKHRVIPRDYALHPVTDQAMHVDFLRLGEGAAIRVKVPVHVINADASPGIKRGATVNIVEHTITLLCPPDRIPRSIDVDLTGLNINDAVHLANLKLPEGAKPVYGLDQTLVTIVPPSGLKEELKAQAAAAAGGAAPAAAPAAGAKGAPAAAGKAPAAGAAKPAAGGAKPAAGAKAAPAAKPAGKK